MTLTVREKEHWKQRISRRIDHAIETLQGQHDPCFRQRIVEEAGRQAWQSLGIAKLHNDCQKIDHDIKSLENRRKDVWAEMLTVVTGAPPGRHQSLCSQPHQVLAAVKSRQAVHERELLRDSELGKRILLLLEEKEELLDTVWLATSSAQIKELWTRFAELLNWEPPKLQRQALSIAPLSDQS